jgi:hypothetical protein
MITTSKQIALAAAGGLVSLLLATQAFAYSAAVINACTGDYLAYCSAYDENSARGARCMRSAAAKLSQGCADALVGAGEISKGEANRLRGKR